MISEVTLDVFDAFCQKYSKNKNGCWEWVGVRNKKGYGRLHVGDRGKVKKIFAHRLSYFLAFGKYDYSLHVLHTCDNPRCVNPRHLWLGTNVDNQKDSVAKGRQAQKKKTHCKRGHPFSTANTYLHNKGHRTCRTCMKIHKINYRRRKLNEKNNYDATAYIE